MRFAPASLVLKAAKALQGTHPLAVVTLPALLRTARRAGADPTAAGGVGFRSTQELELLNEYFKLPHPPIADRPFRALWAVKEDEFWQKEKYPGGSLQRMRKGLADSGQVLRQHRQSGGKGDRWQLLESAGTQLAAWSEQQHLGGSVRLVDLALWFGRNVDVDLLTGTCASATTDIEKLLCWFNEEFRPDVADLVGTTYLAGTPTDYQGVPFAAGPLDDETYEQLGSLPPAPSFTGTLDGLVASIEQAIKRERFELADGLVRRVLVAWLSGDIVILVGQPGTGKSQFASLLAKALGRELQLDDPVTVSITADFDEAEFIGYERLDGSAQLREFSAEVLTTDEPLAARVVVLEELNLASVENYLASVLVATQATSRLIRLPSGDRVQLPVDAFIIGTCNSYRDEPETRVRISSPTKRRSTIITMPNILYGRYEVGGEQAVIDFAIQLVIAEAEKIRNRIAIGQAAQFDSLRLTHLDSVNTPSDLNQDTTAALGRICAAILDTPVGATWLTAGLLRDVALSIAYAQRDLESELLALGEAVAAKVVHQLRGRHTDVNDLRQAIADLPNADEIDSLVQRMMDGPSDELVSLL